MADDLLQDRWLLSADVAVNTLTIRADRVTVHAATTGSEEGCPSCGTVSTRVHSGYVRKLDDSAAGGRRVVVELRVRRFRCGERACPRATVVEQAAGLTFRHGWTGRTSILDPYKSYRHQRLAEGHTIARRLFEEIRERGYPG